MNKIVIIISSMVVIAICRFAIAGELYPQSDLEFPKGSIGDVIENPSKYEAKFLEKHSRQELKDIYYHYRVCSMRVTKYFKDRGGSFSMDEHDNLMEICDKVLADAGIKGSDVAVFLHIGGLLRWPNPFDDAKKGKKK
ncbi:MAG: hypothetical protein V2A66_05560 [Pseudomonadota bacterium]